MLTIVEADKDLCKRVKDGRLLPYQKAYLFKPELREVADLKGLSTVLKELEREPRKAVLRDTPKTLEQSRRLKKLYTQDPQPWVCLDFDGPAPDGCPDYVQEPEGALRFMIDHHWRYLQGVGVHWQLGNSAGVVPASVKMSWHLWVWLDRPVVCCSRWLSEHGFDRSMTNCVQLHYTASPVGVEIPRRSGFIAGGPLVGVKEDPPPSRSGIAYTEGFECSDDLAVQIAGELVALEPYNGERHAAIRSWIIRAVTVQYPSTQEDATRKLVEWGRDEDLAYSEVARLIAWADTGLRSGELEPDISLRPDLGFEDDDEAPLKGEEAKVQKEALLGPGLIEGMVTSSDPFAWLEDNAKRVLGAGAAMQARLRDLWPKGKREFDRILRGASGDNEGDGEPNWAEKADKFLEERASPLAYVDAEWYSFNGAFWERMEEVFVLKEVSDVINEPTTSKVSNMFQQVKFSCLGGYDGEPVGTPFLNGRLMPSGVLVPHSPENSGRYCLDFDYTQGADCPTWKTALGQWFPDSDRQKILREWIHYLITGRNNIQKIMLMVGAQRGGKGTILSVMQDLIGALNYSTPSMSSFASEFGLQSSLGKRALFISDAHLPNRDRSTILDRLKAISGKDRLDVSRKHLPVVKGARLGQIVIACNEMGDISDESNALVDRYSVLKFTTSYIGREDLTLGEKIKAELSGIFNWAMSCPSYRTFTEDTRGKEVKLDMSLASNPVRSWALEACQWEEFGATCTEELYRVFSKWCEDGGLRKPMAKNTFVRKLKGVFGEASVRVVRNGKEVKKELVGVVLTGSGGSVTESETDDSF